MGDTNYVFNAMSENRFSLSYFEVPAYHNVEKDGFNIRGNI